MGGESRYDRLASVMTGEIVNQHERRHQIQRMFSAERICDTLCLFLANDSYVCRHASIYSLLFHG